MPDQQTFRPYRVLRAWGWIVIALFAGLAILPATDGEWAVAAMILVVAALFWLATLPFARGKAVLRGDELMVGRRGNRPIDLRQVTAIALVPFRNGHHLYLITPSGRRLVDGNRVPLRRILRAIKPYIADAEMSDETRGWLLRWEVLDPRPGEEALAEQVSGIRGLWMLVSSADGPIREVQLYVGMLGLAFILSLSLPILAIPFPDVLQSGWSYLPLVAHAGLTLWFSWRMVQSRTAFREMSGLKLFCCMAGGAAMFFGIVMGTLAGYPDGHWIFVTVGLGALVIVLALAMPRQVDRPGAAADRPSES